MSRSWRTKLHPQARARIDETEDLGPVDLLVALEEPLSPAVRRTLEGAGLTLLSEAGTVVAGRVTGRAALERVAAVDAVLRIDLSRPLHGEGA
jgi:hypothetical protein